MDIMDTNDLIELQLQLHVEVNYKVVEQIIFETPTRLTQSEFGCGRYRHFTKEQSC